MKKIVLFILFFNFVVLAWAQNLRVAVPPFTAKSGFSKDDAEILTDLFSSYLVEAGGFEVLTRTEIDKLLDEMKFQASGLTSDSDYARLGAALNARAVIAGNVMKLGSKGFFTVSVIDVESFKVLSSSRTPFDDIVEIVDKMSSLANNIINQIQNPNLLIGSWYAEGWLVKCTLTFNNDGTFSILSYTKNSSDASFRKNSDKPYRENHSDISGEVTGTYSYTKDEFTLNYLISGTRRTIIIENEEYTYDYTGPYKDEGSTVVSYELSDNHRNLKLKDNDFFRYSRAIYNKPGDNYTLRSYFNSFIKTNQ
jgi:TolB-like protein